MLPEGFSIAILTYFPLLDDQNVAPVNCCFTKWLVVGGDWNIGEMYGIMMVNDG